MGFFLALIAAGWSTLLLRRPSASDSGRANPDQRAIPHEYYRDCPYDDPKVAGRAGAEPGAGRGLLRARIFGWIWLDAIAIALVGKSSFGVVLAALLFGSAGGATDAVAGRQLIDIISIIRAW
jgi:hypothetical protein